ncbi:Lrp/AsnC family transcriptional regulator [Hyphococcus sp.]|uniref:Lrp/AsnC family transcriptional regulator n=1 Tax=Hyphococcus sp. TaxID=2038636 RepID=UPI003D0ED674
MIDETDKKILTLLQRDGRLTNAEIADAVGLSVSAAHRRVKALEACGVIKGYGAKVDRAAAGLTLLAYVFVKLDSHAEEHLEAFEKQVNLLDEVVSCSAVSGGGDYILQVVAKDMESFAEVALKKLVRLPGVKDSSSHFVLSSMKEAAGWPLSV